MEKSFDYYFQQKDRGRAGSLGKQDLRVRDNRYWSKDQDPPERTDVYTGAFLKSPTQQHLKC